MASWSDGYWWSNDGLRLHYRDYPGPSDRPPILCIPGLTRNARDFEAVAERLSPDWRVICVELRGRGESGFAKDVMTYMPVTYVQDLETLLRELELPRFVAFGTSLGGLLTMLLSTAHPDRIAGAMVNDVGATLDERGLDRIRSYIGRSQTWPTWLHAARWFSEFQRDVYPRWNLEDWLAQAKRLCRLTTGGRIVFDYDMRIAEPFKVPNGVTGFDAWQALRGLVDVPSLLLRGELSDLLSVETVARMQEELPLMEAVTIPNVGHTPILTEPESVAAIDRLLARIQA
ncbi:alpha/beta hydrolase [Sphingosinicella sp. LY1275]|uniref:alpha/beta fold hydrolase n=1 Tax=Sphingosinicella sp. LY1275 TaxID=3095379 RepID=UPI002ADEEBF8|nr:alpha/beta hydrolase [Sphingosinicella sp. LY1275]MEA1015981.1 alpha/beta hydrolase [Sphingosinicella sp. LY1275]